MMDNTSGTKSLTTAEVRICQENILYEITKDVAQNVNSKLTPKLKEKTCKIIAHSDLIHFAGLHKISTADESTSTILGLLHHTDEELTFEEQTELNKAIIAKIQDEIPKYISELRSLKQSKDCTELRERGRVETLREALHERLSTLRRQEEQRTALTLEWLHHRRHDALSFTDHSTELLNLKTKILELKSRILHLQILQNMFTETGRGVAAYGEVRSELAAAADAAQQRARSARDAVADRS